MTMKVLDLFDSATLLYDVAYTMIFSDYISCPVYICHTLSIFHFQMKFELSSKLDCDIEVSLDAFYGLKGKQEGPKPHIIIPKDNTGLNQEGTCQSLI